jgi:o-succinylbenzoate synthase
MRLRRAILREAELPLRIPFRTSFGLEKRRRILLLELESDEVSSAWSECVAGRDPFYSSETVESASSILRRYLLPEILEMEEPRAATSRTSFQRVRGHPMAKAALEMALHDLDARRERRSLARHLGGRRRRVEVGVSVGIEGGPAALVSRVSDYLSAGYHRVKLKIAPGSDSEFVHAVRQAFPQTPLWVDANQAYSPSDIRSIRRWASANRVELVEQPFAETDLASHARLQRGAPFRVCLDESIPSAEALTEALHRRALQALNVKPGRVGGHRVALQLAAMSGAAGCPAWVGGMLESGVGRSHNVALASTSDFTLPHDISASDRYYVQDIIEPPFELEPGSTLRLPSGPGIGVEVDRRALRRATRRSWELRPEGG